MNETFASRNGNRLLVHDQAEFARQQVRELQSLGCTRLQIDKYFEFTDDPEDRIPLSLIVPAVRWLQWLEQYPQIKVEVENGLKQSAEQGGFEEQIRFASVIASEPHFNFPHFDDSRFLRGIVADRNLLYNFFKLCSFMRREAGFPKPRAIIEW